MRFGEELITLCEGAQTEVFLAAPFIKIGALKRLIEATPTAASLTVVVRFLPADLAVGVTDFEIVEYLLARSKTRLLAQPVLHAKLYRVDGRAMIGSANITGRALGWSSTPNLELLLELQADNERVRQVEAEIIGTSYPLTAEIADSVRLAASALQPAQRVTELLDFESTDGSAMWIPTCLRPEFLWEVQMRGDAYSATQGVVRAAKRDLGVLGIPPGLTKTVFDSMAKGIFMSSSFYSAMMIAMADNGFSDADAAAWLGREHASSLSESPSDTWAAIKNWMKYFNPSGTYITAETERTKLTHVIG